MGKNARDGAGEFKLSEPIWARGEHEPKLWFQRFMSYLRMGRKRSKLAVYKQEKLSLSGARHTPEGREKARKGVIKTVPRAWREASHRFLWDKRAEAFDEYELSEDQKRWQEQHRKDREAEHAQGKALIERAKEMLSFPLSKVEYPTGVETVTEPSRRAEIMAQLRADGVDEETLGLLEAMPFIVVSITQIHPMRWQMRDAAILAQAGSRLMRQATGAPTNYQQHEVFGEKRKDGKPRSLFPVERISIEQAPKRELSNLKTNAGAEPLKHESPKSGANHQNGTD